MGWIATGLYFRRTIASDAEPLEELLVFDAVSDRLEAN